jgi:dynein heavy chain
LASQTPEAFDLEFVGKKFPTAYEESMNTVLFQECVRYNAMLILMKSSLGLVQLALKGEVVMSEDLDKMASCIFNNMVPSNWLSVSFLSMKPLASWI